MTSSTPASISIHRVSATFLAPLASRALCTIRRCTRPRDRRATLTSRLSHPCTSGYRIWWLSTYSLAMLAGPAAAEDDAPGALDLAAACRVLTLTMASSVASRRDCSDLSRLLSSDRFLRSFCTCSRNFSCALASMVTVGGRQGQEQELKKARSTFELGGEFLFSVIFP